MSFGFQTTLIAAPYLASPRLHIKGLLQSQEETLLDWVIESNETRLRRFGTEAKEVDAMWMAQVSGWWSRSLRRACTEVRGLGFWPRAAQPTEGWISWLSHGVHLTSMVYRTLSGGAISNLIRLALL